MSVPEELLAPAEVVAESTANKSAPGTQQFGRQFSFAVGASDGQAVELNQFRCVFHIQRGDYQNPNSCDVRVYNLSDSTANGLAQKEFTQVALQAGYPGNYGLIFRGTLAQVRRGRENQTDSYVDFTAGDGDEAYNFATIIASQGAGPGTADRGLSAMLKSMEANSISPGYIPNLSSNGLPRGRIYYGNTRDELREFAANNDLLWSIQDGKLTMIPQTSYIAGDTPTISPDTGLIGIPEQTQNGIKMRVLLNPSIKIGQAVKLEASVNQYRFGLDFASQASNYGIAQQNKLNGAGLYYVMAANHSGDTRGNEWYTDLTCLAIDATINPGDTTLLQAFQVPQGPIQRN